MNEENNNEVFQCICGKQFNNKISLSRHKSNCKIYQESVKEEKLKLIKEKESRRLPNGMFKCEICGKEHDGSYGSGRFCSKHCRRVWIGKHSMEKRMKNGTFISPFSSINKKLQAPYGKWKCEQCNLIFETRAKLYIHNHEVHPVPKG